MKKLLVVLAILFLIVSANAAPIINPSVQEESSICKHWYSKWICDIAPKGDPGAAGAPGASGEGNITNYYNASLNLTSYSNETWFYNASIGNLSSFSNISNFFNPSNFTSISNTSNYYNTSQTGSSDHHLLTNLTTGDDHSQYALLAGRAGGQVLIGSSTSGGKLYLNGSSSNNGDILLNPNGGKVGINTELPMWNLHILSKNYDTVMYLDSIELGTPYMIFNGHKSGNDAGVGSVRFDNRGDSIAGIFAYRSVTNDSGYMTFNTQSPSGDNNERMRIGRLGNVSIGITSPSAQFDTTGSVRFRNFGAGAATFDAGGNISSVSDEKAKTDINSFSKGLNEILQINPIIYKYTSESGLDTKNDYVGFSAQNLKSAIPEIVYSKPDVKYEIIKEKGKDGEEETKTIEIPLGTNTLSIYDRGIMALMVNAIKEQQLQIEDQQKQIDELKIRLDKLEGNKI